MAHVRRKFHDVIKLKPSPIADEALSRIGALYDIEDRIRGMSADERRTLRQQHARPILADLKSWIEERFRRCHRSRSWPRQCNMPSRDGQH